jgi:hypothetical protein
MKRRYAIWLKNPKATIKQNRILGDSPIRRLKKHPRAAIHRLNNGTTRFSGCHFNADEGVRLWQPDDRKQKYNSISVIS